MTKYGTAGRIEWDDRRETICMWERVGRKVRIGNIESLETWKKKMEKYQENWNFGKYLENWKYRKF